MSSCNRTDSRIQLQKCPDLLRSTIHGRNKIGRDSTKKKILEDILNGKMNLSQHLTLIVNDFGSLAGGVNFPHTLSKMKGTQMSAILCTESILPLQTEHYNPMLTDKILDSCSVITEK